LLEQGTILLQCINLSQKKFRFDQFFKNKGEQGNNEDRNGNDGNGKNNAKDSNDKNYKNYPNYPNPKYNNNNNTDIFTNNNNKMLIKNEATIENADKQHIQLINQQLDESKKELYLLKNSSLKLNEETIETLKNQDNYRSIIKEKMKIEKKMKKELMRIAQEIYMKKIEKKKFSESNTDLFKKLNKQRIDFLFKKDVGQYDKALLEKAFASLGKYGPEDELIINKKMKYNQRMTQQEERIRISENAYHKLQKKTEQEIEKNKKTIEAYEDSIEHLKLSYNNYAKEQRSYFIDLLKKGIDVR